MLTETILLDISKAQQQIKTLENDLAQINTKPIQLAVEAPADSFKEIDRAIEQVEDNIRQVNQQLDLMEVGAGSVQVEVKQLSQALGISEDEAQQLVGRFAQSRVEARQVESAIKEVSQALGLSNAEARQFERSLHDAGRAARQTDDAVDSVGRRGQAAFGNLGIAVASFGSALVAVQGLRAFIGFADQAIGKASDLAESTSKTNVVFGDLADQVKKFAATGPQALGLSTQAALEATSTFGNLFVALGLSQEAAADLSPDIVQLAADLASFNNIEVGDALEKLRSGLVGETEPLRALGVAINEAAVNAKALELGLVGSNGQISEAAKVQARYALILEQTTTAQGDFARTADGIANKQRTLNAEFDDFQAKVGEALIPAFEALIDVAPQALALLEGLIPVIQSVATSFGDAVDTIQPFLENITKIQQGIGAVSDAFAVSRAAVNQSFELFASFATLQFDDFISNLGETRDVVGEFIDRFQDRASITGLADDLAGGADATEAFIGRLQDVALQNDVTSGTFDRLAQTAGLAGDELIAAVRDLLDNAGAYKLDAQAVQALRHELAKLLGVENAVDFARKGRGGSRPGGGFGFDPTLIDSEANAIERLASVAQAFDVTDLVGQIQSMADGFSDVAPEIQDLPDLMSDAREALKDEQGGIVEDFDTFFANLKSAFAARQDFQANLLILRALGLDDLADTFEAIGLDAAGALADAITDPTKAAEAERVLEAQARDQAAGFRAAFTAELASMIAVLPVEVQLAQIQIPDIAAALNIRGFSGGGAGGVGDLILNINNATTNDVTTDAARAAQIIAAVANRTGGQVRGTG